MVSALQNLRKGSRPRNLYYLSVPQADQVGFSNGQPTRRSLLTTLRLRLRLRRGRGLLGSPAGTARAHTAAKEEAEEAHADPEHDLEHTERNVGHHQKVADEDRAAHEVLRDGALSLGLCLLELLDGHVNERIELVLHLVPDGERGVLSGSDLF